MRPLVEYEAHLQESGADMLLEAPEADDPNIAAFLERYRSRAYRMPRWVDRHRDPPDRQARAGCDAVT